VIDPKSKPMNLEGKVAVITGASSGIGRALARRFASLGANVVAADINEDGGQETVGMIEKDGGKAVFTRCDVTSYEDAKAAVATARESFGRIDILVNNAAEHTARDEITEISEEQLERTFRTNIFGVFFMIQAALPHLKEGAVILNTGSVTGLHGHPLLMDYASTKGALHVLTQSLAKNLSEKGIRVNCVAPGPVWTPLINSTFGEEEVREFGSDSAWERPAQPAELAPAFVFLASADARYITGEVLGVTGKTTTR
jgi:NAD(P)-dependent dehydrogenase (short-subunit alcohol dehydrogenase family)